MPQMRGVKHYNIEFKTLKGLLFLALAVLVLLWLASVSVILVMQLAESIGGQTAEWLADRGWPRVMRRCVVFWSVVFVAAYLRRVGWRGWRDAGFATDDPLWAPRPWWLPASLGAVYGLVTLGVVTALNMYLGVRCLKPLESVRLSANVITGFIMTGVFASLAEETICRGILFRLAARAWSVLTAALAVSVLFALAHFINPPPEAFRGNTFLSAGANVFVSTLVTLPAGQGFWLRLVNLTLLGMVLSVFVIRTRTIWFGVGAHAAWIWVIKFHTHLTDPDWSSKLIPWFGRRGDFTDSIAVTALLAGVGCLALCWSGPAGVVIRKKGLRWHVAPRARGAFEKWVDRHFSIASGFHREESGEDERAANGYKVLKEYESCRVAALDEWVVKEYRPKPGWKRVRFAVMPSRARRGFILARELGLLGIHTPEAVAWAVDRKFLLARTSYAITREIKNARPLTSSLPHLSHDPAAASEMMSAYGKLMALFHANRYSNRDFKHENVMRSDSSLATLWVVDLDGVSRKLRLTRRRAKKDLMRVGRSLAEEGLNRESDVTAFFDAYNAGVRPELRRTGFPP